MSTRIKQLSKRANRLNANFSNKNNRTLYQVQNNFAVELQYASGACAPFSAGPRYKSGRYAPYLARPSHDIGGQEPYEVELYPYIRIERQAKACI